MHRMHVHTPPPPSLDHHADRALPLSLSQVNTTLTEVDLSLNYIDDKGGKAIADALDSNKTLKVLCMSGNEIEDKELRKKVRSRK